MKNSDFRHYAQAASDETSPVLKYILTALVIVIPAASVYGYNVGLFTKQNMNAMMAGRMPILSQGGAVQVAAAAPAAAMPAPSASSAPQSVAPARAAVVAPPSANRSDMAGNLGMALQVQMNMGMMFEMVAEMMTDDGKKIGPVTTNNIVEYCRQQAQQRLRDRGNGGLSGRAAADAHMFDVFAERVHCLMTRRPEKLCEKPIKGEFLRQYGNYMKIRDGALSMLVGNPGASAEGRAHMERGVHKALRDELVKLATRGYVNISEFGWFPSDDLKALIGSVKPTVQSCKA